ncbi:sulfotransferase [Novosphingobium sp. BL-8H]|uniref:sulfotransferase n=1 Tax=Novosphingobium sp. BL-8H TaxID=3127640 RepID=UPI003756795F
MSEHPSDQTKLRVIYLAGYGRSGSTLLDIALGMRPDVFGAGELTALARHAWKNGEYCACGVTVHSCPFWGAVMARADGEADEAAASDVDAAHDAQAVLDNLADLQRRVESLAAWRRVLGRFLPDTLNHYHGANRGLFLAVTAEGGRGGGNGTERAVYVLDSSKLPGRALALSSMPGIDLRVIHLVRDPRAVAWSMSRPHRKQIEAGVQRELRPKPAFYVALRWSMVNLVCEWLCRRVGPGRTIRVRYEDFVADPPAVLEAIRTQCAPDLPGLADDGAPPPEVLRPGHQVAGSRHRMQEHLVIREDHMWERQMPDWARRLVSWITGPLLRRYGYMPGARADHEGRPVSASRPPLVEKQGRLVENKGLVETNGIGAGR